MSSAAHTLHDAAAVAGHGKRSLYRSACACCTPEPDGKEGKPQRRAVSRPLLAWRTRLAAQQTLDGDGDVSGN